jgi:predicted RNA-binding Zn-ribbon protein involved in translation (DUF1610 family)
MSERAEMIGKQFGRLTPVEVIGTKRIHLVYRCVCECGNEVEVLGNSLRSGNTKSCGCIRRPNLVGIENDHGIVISKIRNQMWEVSCKHCGENHIQNQREIRRNSHPMSCPAYKPPNKMFEDKRDSVIRRAYGITLVEYDQMLHNQNNKCAICGNGDEVENRRLAIDHCHESGKVRGLLCGKCNRGLGLFYDNQELLESAIHYLNKNSLAR